MTCAPTATRTRDLPLMRSFRDGRSAVAFLVRASLVVVWLPPNVRGSRPVLARTWHVLRLSRSAVTGSARVCLVRSVRVQRQRRGPPGAAADDHRLLMVVRGHA